MRASREGMPYVVKAGMQMIESARGRVVCFGA
jgi:hypothetical protein